MYIQQLTHMHIGYLGCHEYVVQAQQTLLCLEIFVCFRKPFSVPEGYFPMLLPFEGMLLVAPKACFVATKYSFWLQHNPFLLLQKNYFEQSHWYLHLAPPENVIAEGRA